MTEIEKKAKESAANYVQQLVDHSRTIENDLLLQCQLRQSHQDGYIAGAKENGLQWHDLRKNPEDLPTYGKWIICKRENPLDPFIAMTDAVNDDEVFLVGYETDETNGFECVTEWAEIP